MDDFRGVYKIPNVPFIHASHRGGGLEIFKLSGKSLQGKAERS
jgi:hypothetical protein